jgi:membrane associated rhomboid family serine protease
MLVIGDQGSKFKRIPWVTGGLILVNIVIFLIQQGVGERAYGFALVPKEITTGKDLVKPERMKLKTPKYVRNRDGHYVLAFRDEWVPVPQYPGPFPIFLTLITSMYLHGSWAHLLGNMWFLLIFGRNVESALGHARFLAFYTVCGVVGGVAHVVSGPNSIIPCLGASGAISGVMGGYVAVYPLHKIKLWLGFHIVVDVPAIGLLGCWFVLQYVAACVDLEMGQFGGGIAYWDHIGGFLAGVIVIYATLFYLKWLKAKAEAEAEAEAQQVEDPADKLFTGATPSDPKVEIAAFPSPRKAEPAPAPVEPLPEPTAVVADDVYEKEFNERAAALSGPEDHLDQLFSGKTAQRPKTDPFASFLPAKRGKGT